MEKTLERIQCPQNLMEISYSILANKKFKYLCRSLRLKNDLKYQQEKTKRVLQQKCDDLILDMIKQQFTIRLNNLGFVLEISKFLFHIKLSPIIYQG